MSANRTRKRTPLGVGRSLLPHVAVFVALIAAWTLVVRTGLVSQRVVALPGDTWSALVDLFATGDIWPHFRATVFEAAVGLLVGVVVALVLGSISAVSTTFNRLFRPYMVLFQCTPRVVIAPMLFIWLGFGYGPKVVLVAAIVFFPVLVNTLAGLTSVSASELELFRSLGASRTQIFFRLQVYVAAPFIFAGLKTAASFALVGAVVGEFVSAERGLGVLSQRYSFLLATDYAYAVFVVLAFVGLLFFAAVELLEQRIVFWNFERGLNRRSARRARSLARRARSLAAEPAEPETTGSGSPSLVQ